MKLSFKTKLIAGTLSAVIIGLLLLTSVAYINFTNVIEYELSESMSIRTN